MENHITSSIKIKNYKCFGNTSQGFNEIKPINIIIGKNNSGKSSLLDLIQYITTDNFIIPRNKFRSAKASKIEVEQVLLEKELNKVFRDHNRDNFLGNHRTYGKRYYGEKIKYEIGKNNRFIEVSNSDDKIKYARKYWQDLVQQLEIPLNRRKFKKISSERDIVPEQDDIESLTVEPNGAFATNLIQNFLHLASLDADLVRKQLLNDLNGIFKPDAHFNAIHCQKIDADKWEIFLEEISKGNIQLSESGSGLKTIILCLIQIILTPVVDKKKLKEYVFVFEELENNLHPALIRSLLLFIRNTAVEKGSIFFITTHSNVVIDLFSKDEAAQILHVVHEENESTVNPVSTYYDNIRILDDLDVRASDLLQSNMVIWVEGPSDRIYLNKWISLYSNNTLYEGAHYQIVFYGGRLLSHLTFNQPDEKELSNLIKLLTVNRNAFILIDSDKRNQQTQLNDTKKRIISEMEESSGDVWVTKGKEIENYIPVNVINKALNKNFEGSVNKYGNFEAYLNKRESGLGKKYIKNKVKYSHVFADHFTRSDFVKVLDLSGKVASLVQLISKVNNRY